MDQAIMADLEAQTTYQESPAIFKKANRPVTLKFEDVTYNIKTKKGRWPSLKSEKKVILKGITGMVFPGEMLAMLGPSGSGKTTLLTALGGRLGGKLGGSISYNGLPFSNRMKRNTGFVTQDDVLYPHLTVNETLVFTALLRLPHSLTKEEIVMHAEAVIAQLGLTKCKNSIIGGPLLRGVSGGERKRVSIGLEMLINPSLLFLDEPTSGLDYTTAERIVSTLWKLAKGGRTIAMTIHQPSSGLFYMFHKVLLLSEGNPVYFGNGSEAMDYFSNIGYAPSVAMNPSDFLLDLANGISSDDTNEDQATVKQNLVCEYKSNIANRLKAELQLENHCQDGLEEQQSGRWSTTWWQQFSVLYRRGVKERKHESFSNFKIGQVLVAALLSGLLWWQSDASRIQDRIGLLYFYIGFWGFFALYQAIFTFPQDRMLLEKERSSGMYRLSSYFMSRIVSDLPMDLVLPTIFVIITYWMGGLEPTAGNFLHTLFVLLFSVLVTQSLGLALGAMIMDLKFATIFGSVIMTSFMLASGFYVQHMPPFIEWIKYVSISHYSYKLLLRSQYKPGDTYPCGRGEFCSVEKHSGINHVGLNGQAISAVALATMLVGYLLTAYIALMRIGVTKKR